MNTNERITQLEAEVKALQAKVNDCLLQVKRIHEVPDYDALGYYSDVLYEAEDELEELLDSVDAD